MGFHSLSASILFLVTVNHLCLCADEALNSTFRATNEWQKVEDGQIIPAGLHVRINLQTGYKEAKLPDDKSDSTSLITTSDSGEVDNSQDSATIGPDELKRIMRNIKGSNPAKENPATSKFRSYEELKKDFIELNVQVRTDMEILTNLIDNFKKFDLLNSKSVNIKTMNEAEDEEILSTLVDLEYLVHQYDNAKEFAKLNGFTEVIHKSLNSTNSEIRSEALRLHGSATQSNPKVQIAALESGTINLLLKILTFDEDLSVRSRSLYALSCLLRGFPAAQQKFITDGGLTVFATVFDEEKQDLMKLQVKIITLIHDLLFERKDTKISILEEESNNQTNSKLLDLQERLRQYEKMDIEKKLLEQNWCGRISNWFIKQNLMIRFQTDTSTTGMDHAVPNTDQHDLIEKVVDTLYVLSDICKLDFKDDKPLMELLFSLGDVYSRLAETEWNSKDQGSDNYYSSLSNILKMLTEKLQGTLLPKEEL